MKLYRTILVITAALFAGTVIAAPSSNYDFGGKMRAMAYDYEIKATPNSGSEVAQKSNVAERSTLLNKKHHSSHAKKTHKKAKPKVNQH